MEGKALTPLIKWAQRADVVFLTVELRDVKNEKIEITETSLTFDAESNDKKYHFNLEFFDEINKQETKWSKTGFSLRFNIVKKNPKPEYWTRLVKDNKKNQYITVDWDKYIDQDAEEEEGKKGLGDWDPSAMQGMGGMGGMGGFPGMGGMGGFPGGMGGFPGMQGMGGFPGMGGQDDEQGQGDLPQGEQQQKPAEQAQTK